MSYKIKIKKLKEIIIDSIFREEKICFICDNYNPYIKNNICSFCLEEYSLRNKKTCKICGKKIFSIEDSKENRCLDCIKTFNYFEKGFSAFIYKGNLKNKIADFKYRDRLYLKNIFAREMSVYIKRHFNSLNIDIILPVPMEKNRKKNRGYNQAEILSKELSKFLKIPNEEHILTRDKLIKSQMGLSRLQRIKNIKKTISIKNSNLIEGKNILIVDDVYTTGATVNECARVLKENGASSIVFITTASTISE